MLANLLFLTAAESTGPSFFETYGTVIFLVLMLAVMYFTVVIPQRKEEKARNELRNSLEVGDGVVTINDATMIQRYLAEMDTEGGRCGEPYQA